LDYTPTDPLLTAEQSAIETGQSLPGFWKGVRAGRFPEPFYPASRAPRWRLSELRTALEKTRAKPSDQKVARNTLTHRKGAPPQAAA
jgi:predicted DNA-binding transcriptional regulator AlpA